MTVELSKEQDTITMAGGLIANASRDANGNLTNKGQAQVKASKLIVDKLHDYDDGYSLGLGLGSDIRAKFSLKDKARDLSSALVNLQVTVDGEIIGAENLASEFVVPKMSGTDIDLDVTFASSIIRNEPKVDVAPASPPDDEELDDEESAEESLDHDTSKDFEDSDQQKSKKLVTSKESHKSKAVVNVQKQDIKSSIAAREDEGGEESQELGVALSLVRSIAGTNSAEASVGVLSTNAFGAVDMMGAGVNLAALRGLASTAVLCLLLVEFWLQQLV